MGQFTSNSDNNPNAVEATRCRYDEVFAKAQQTRVFFQIWKSGSNEILDLLKEYHMRLHCAFSEIVVHPAAFLGSLSLLRPSHAFNQRTVLEIMAHGEAQKQNAKVAAICLISASPLLIFCVHCIFLPHKTSEGNSL